MRALRLDFARRAPRWPAWLLLGVGGVLLADALLERQRLQLEVAEQQRRLQGPRVARSAPKEALPEQTQREVDAARRVLQRLSLPWENLLHAIESAVDRDTALLSIAPDAERGELQLVGEARHFGAVLDFVDRLERAPALQQVHLLSHAVREDSPERPLQFTLAARWRPQR